MSDYAVTLHSVRCDRCDSVFEELPYMHDTYRLALDAARQDGWKHTKRGDDVCGLCQENEL